MDRLEAAKAGFANVDTDQSVKDAALQNLETWLTKPGYEAYRPQIDWLIDQGNWSLLVDSFYQVLPFGTGGRRGPVGIGPNRMNLWTLGASVQGHCQYLKERFPDVDPIRVVLAYDVRKFLDKNGNYNPDLPNPVLGLTSRAFCEYAAGVYAANGIQSLILPTDSQRYVSTPELSYTIRETKAHGGLNMTASHNPPDDNGSKFYNEHGAQPVPPDDQIMSDLVDQVTTIKHTPFQEAVKAHQIQFLDDSVYENYIDLCRKQTFVPAPKSDELRVVFTPLQGVGGMNAGKVLEMQGFQPIPVPGQMEPNGQFPNVSKTPNPEVPECLDRAEAVAHEKNADLVIATDPDSDRLGGLARKSLDGELKYQFILGQEICSLLTYFKLSRLSSDGNLPQSPIVITTEVTTSQVTRIARHYGAQIVNDLLVGFKYHADVLLQLEQTGQYKDHTGSPDDLILAIEESHGVLATPHIRDKDSACGVLMLAELALHLKRQGRTIPELLDTLAVQFGYYRNELFNLVMKGSEGQKLMNTMLDTLRNKPPMNVAGLPVTSFEDMWDEEKYGNFKGATDRLARNFLVFRFDASAELRQKFAFAKAAPSRKRKSIWKSAPHPVRPTAPTKPGKRFNNESMQRRSRWPRSFSP